MVQAATVRENKFMPRKGEDLPPLNIGSKQTPLLREVVASKTEDDHSKANFKLRKESPSRIEQVSVKCFPRKSLPKD